MCPALHTETFNIRLHRTGGESVCKPYVPMQELPCALPDQQSPYGALRLLAREESMERFGECGIRFARQRGGFDP